MSNYIKFPGKINQQKCHGFRLERRPLKPSEVVYFRFAHPQAFPLHNKEYVLLQLFWHGLWQPYALVERERFLRDFKVVDGGIHYGD